MLVRWTVCGARRPRRFGPMRFDLFAFFVSLLMSSGDLPTGARMSVRFDPAQADAGAAVSLELSITPPPGSLLLALAQPKSLGAPIAVDLDTGLFKLAGSLEEPAVGERLERALQSQKVRYYPQSLGGTVVVRLPLSAPKTWEDDRAEIRGAVTLMFVEIESGKLTLASAVPISATLEKTKPTVTPPISEMPNLPLEAVSTKSPPIESPPAVKIDVPAPVKIETDNEVAADVFPLPTQRWFFSGVAVGFLAVLAGPVGVYDQRRWWARWLGWRRLQAWTTVAVAAFLTVVALLLPARTALPAVLGAAAFGAMLFATGGGPGVFSANFFAAALRAQPLLGLALSLALLANAAGWDVTAGFALVFLARSCAPAVTKREEDEFDDEEDELPRRKAAKSRRYRADAA